MTRPDYWTEYRAARARIRIDCLPTLSKPSSTTAWITPRMTLCGITVSSGGVRGVWNDRLLRLKMTQSERSIDLSDVTAP